MSKSDFDKTLMERIPSRLAVVWCPNISRDDMKTGGDPNTDTVPCSPLMSGGVYLREDNTSSKFLGLRVCFFRVMAMVASCWFMVE